MEGSVRHLKWFSPDSCQKLYMETGQRTINRLLTHPSSVRDAAVKQCLGGQAHETGRWFAVKLCRRVQECEGRSENHQPLVYVGSACAGCLGEGEKGSHLCSPGSRDPRIQSRVKLCSHSRNLDL